jgi:hypothetical protein
MRIISITPVRPVDDKAAADRRAELRAVAADLFTDRPMSSELAALLPKPPADLAAGTIDTGDDQGDVEAATP